MTLDEYLAQLKSTGSVSLKKKNPGFAGRKTNEMGGKMHKMKKADEEAPSDMSIMSAVSRKAAVAERTVKDSTHVAVADNAKNQEFFKDTNNERVPVLERIKIYFIVVEALGSYRIDSCTWKIYKKLHLSTQYYIDICD